MVKDNHIRSLIERYYRGVLDDKSAVELAAWVASSNEASRMFKQELQMLKESQDSVMQSKSFIRKIKRGRRKVVLGRTAGVAAACALILCLAFVFPPIFQTDETKEEKVVETVEPLMQKSPSKDGKKTAVNRAPEAKIFTAPKTEILSLTLPDGTSLVLNKGSKLKVAPDFGKHTRTVNLDGEAWFDVAKNPSLPFRILCGNEEFIVRGTTFNIVSYSSDNFSVVTLHSGSLEAHVKDDMLLLDPGDELRIDDEEDNISRRKVDVSNSTTWMNDGALHFSSLPLKYVAAQIGHKYDVKIRVHSSISNIVYDGDIDNEPLDVALRLLAITAPVKLSITNLDGEYYITKHNNL